MKTLIAVSLLAFCVLNAIAAPAVAQVMGPVCLRIGEFGEIAQFFALPTDGGHMILTGQSLTSGGAYSGSGYVAGTDFTFTLTSGLLPGVMEGVLNLDTGEGVGTVTYADTNAVQPLSYSSFPPPCEAANSARFIFASCEECNGVCPGVCFLQAELYCRCYLFHLRTAP